MGSRKNYKASVEVGLEVSIRFFLCVLLCLPHSFHPPCALSSCAIFGHSCTCVVVSNGVSVVFRNKRRSSKKLSQHQWTDGTYCFTQNRKQDHCPLVHHSQKVRTSWSFNWQGVSFSCSCASQKGWLLSCESHLFRADSGTLDLALSPRTWSLSPLNNCSQETLNLVPLYLEDKTVRCILQHIYCHPLEAHTIHYNWQCIA